MATTKATTKKPTSKKPALDATDTFLAAQGATPPRRWQKLERHELSAQFSLPITDDERLALATDIEANGQHHEITLYEGRVLDGWERYTACIQKGIEPRFNEYTGTDPAAVAFGANTIRRKLSSLQKVLMAAHYYTQTREHDAPPNLKSVAKLAACDYTRLSQMCQMLNSDAAPAKAFIGKMKAGTDCTSLQFNEALVDAGIVRTETVETRHVRPVDDEADDDAIDSLLGEDDVDDLLGEEASGPTARPSKRAASDAMEAPGSSSSDRKMPRVEHNKRATESPASALAKEFRALTEPERAMFFKFAGAGVCESARAMAIALHGYGPTAAPADTSEPAAASKPATGRASKPTAAAPASASKPASKPATGRKARA